MAQDGHEDLHLYDEEEIEVRGNLSFKPSIEVLPKTKRTEELQKRKIEELKKKKAEADRVKKEREADAARRLQAEAELKKEKQRAAERKKELERKKREEEEQKQKMEGGLQQILASLKDNTSVPHITVCGVQLTAARVRLLTQEFENNTSCMSLDVSRKGLRDEDGITIATMLQKNNKLQKLECEGNNFGVKAAEAFAEALRKNEGLRTLNLESNNLTANSNDQHGIIALAEALRENRTLRVLMLSKNGITQQAGDYLVKAMEANDSLIIVDLSGNDPTLSIDSLRRIDAAVKKNRERLSAIRRAERRERFALYNEEFKCRQHCMQVEAMRLEIEAHEERRLNRAKTRFENWDQEKKDREQAIAEKEQELIADAVDRAGAMSGKKKKKGKAK